MCYRAETAQGGSLVVHGDAVQKEMSQHRRQEDLSRRHYFLVCERNLFGSGRFLYGIKPHECWSDTFYTRQAAEAGVNTADIHLSSHTLAARVTAHLGSPSRLLELGSGGGQFAVAASLLGHDVTAIERVPLLVSHGRSLALNYQGSASGSLPFRAMTRCLADTSAVFTEV